MDIFEPGDTRQFTFQSSVAPDSAPNMAIYDKTETLVSSMTSTSSDSTHYFAMVTMPTTEGIYIGRWTATSTVGGTAYPFKRSVLFNVIKPRSVN